MRLLFFSIIFLFVFNENLCFGSTIRVHKYERIVPSVCYLKKKQFTKENINRVMEWVSYSKPNIVELSKKLHEKIIDLKIPFGIFGQPLPDGTLFRSPAWAYPWKYFDKTAGYTGMDCITSAALMVQALNIIGIGNDKVKIRFVGATIGNGYNTEVVSKNVLITGKTEEVFVYVELQKKGNMSNYSNTYFNWDAVCEVTDENGQSVCFNLSFGLVDMKGSFEDLLRPKYDKDGVTLLNPDAKMVNRYLWVDKEGNVIDIPDPIPYELWMNN